MNVNDALIQNHIEKTILVTLLTRYFGSIDDKQFDIAIVQSTFTEDAEIIRPNGSKTTGHNSIQEINANSFARFKATQHLLTDFIVDINGNTATLRANLTGMHLWADNEKQPSLNGKHFHAGVVLTAKAIKSGADWRIRELAYRSIWRIGDGMAEMANFLKKPTGE